MTYDLREMEKLGAEHERLQAKVKDVRERLHAEVLKANAAGVRQIDIVKASRYTRDRVRVIVDKKGKANG